jgi:hypothetical protein
MVICVKNIFSRLFYKNESRFLVENICFLKKMARCLLLFYGIRIYLERIWREFTTSSRVIDGMIQMSIIILKGDTLRVLHGP